MRRGAVEIGKINELSVVFVKRVIGNEIKHFCSLSPKCVSIGEISFIKIDSSILFRGDKARDDSR